MPPQPRRPAPLLALALLVPLLVAGARASDELSSGDRLRVLYATQFTFSRRGLPLARIEVARGRAQLEVAVTEGALRVLPSGEGGPEVRAGARWRVRRVSARPGRHRHWVVAERVPARRRGALAERLAAWRRRGYAPQTFEVGAMFAIAGEVWDNRSHLVALSAHDDERVARARADALRRRGLAAELYRQTVEPPRGVLEARPVGAEAAGGGRAAALRVRVNDVLWLAPDRPGARLVLDGRPYAGSLYVVVGGDGQLTAVNEIEADRLLYGLVPAEIFPSAPLEALKAQAVTARGELLATLGTRHFGEPFLMCATTHCQVYAGAGREDPRTSRAVDLTRGEVLVRARGARVGDLVHAVYSASCGGHGEDNDAVWPAPPDPQLRGRPDRPRDQGRPQPGGLAGSGPAVEARVRAFLDGPPSGYCGRTRLGAAHARWEALLSAAALGRALAAVPGGRRLRRVDELRVLRRGVSGRALAVLLRGPGGELRVEGELRIRRLLGGLKSSLFSASPDGAGGFRFRGAGYGHGVGMCQLGAIGMAERGLDYRAILGHYYRGARLRRLY